MPKLSDGALLPPLPPAPTPSSAQTMERTSRNLQINAKLDFSFFDTQLNCVSSGSPEKAGRKIAKSKEISNVWIKEKCPEFPTFPLIKKH